MLQRDQKKKRKSYIRKAGWLMTLTWLQPINFFSRREDWGEGKVQYFIKELVILPISLAGLKVSPPS